MAVEQHPRGVSLSAGDLLRRRLMRAAKLLDAIVEDVSAGVLPDDRGAFILAELERGETFASIADVLGISRQRVHQLVAQARARSSNGS
jgi:DNA-directed RNA polymerase specialized sigma24 family protein